MKTPYDVLGVAPDADEQAIASAFREAAKACHPDLNPEDRAAEQQFKQVIAARDALKNPEWRALYRFVQLRRQHDRRHWMITLASCVVSAVVSAGLVSLLQKPSISEPLLEDGVSLLAANWNPEADGPRRFELAGSAADSVRAPAGEPAQTFNAEEMNAGSRNERDETGDKRRDLAALGMAAAASTAQATPAEGVQQGDSERPAPKEQSVPCRKRIGNRAAGPRQPGIERCAESTRASQSRRGPKLQRRNAADPASALLSLLDHAVRGLPGATRPKQASIHAPRAAQKSRPAHARSNECRVSEVGTCVEQR